MPKALPLKLDLTLEFLTPAVLGGARPRTCDPYMPLRPASLRGLWRYWFRAIAASLMFPERGGTGREQMLIQLRRAESQLFGDTKQRSRLIVLPPEISPPSTLPIPGPDSGLRYLGYGLFEDRRPPGCIPERATATVACRLRLPHTGGADARAICATLWTWAALGGIGGRSRRGFGSVRLVKIDCPNGPPELVKPWNDLAALAPTPDAYLAKLGEGIGRAQDALLAFLKNAGIGLRQIQNDATDPHPAIRNLDGIAALRALPGTYPSGRDALDHAGQLFRNYRSTLVRNQRGQPPLPDYFAVKSSLSAPFTPPRHVDRAAFGLPLRFYYRSLNGLSTNFSARPRGSDRPADRLASPLMFRVYALTPERDRPRYGVALINFAGKANAPPLQGCDLAQRGGKSPIAPPSGQLIHDFITWAINQPAPRSR